MDTPPDTDAACYALPSSPKLDEPSSTMLDRCDIAQEAPGPKCATQPKYGFAACHAALETYKILVEILTHVGTTPPDGTKTLLFCQKVNKNFKSAIERSPILQQALFFKLAPVGGERFGVDGANPLFGPDCDTYRLFTCPFPRELWVADDKKMYCDADTQKQLYSSAGKMYPSHKHFPMSAPQLHSDSTNTVTKDGRLTMFETVRELTALAHAPRGTLESDADYDKARTSIMNGIYEVSMILQYGPRNWAWESGRPRMTEYVGQEGETITVLQDGRYRVSFDRRRLFYKANPLYGRIAGASLVFLR